MPSAEIITIGTEILLGEIVDTNARHIARALRLHGIDIYRTTSIGDNVDRIAEAIRSALDRADIIITTGGLGPTVDDPTREAVARAFNVPLEFREALWQQVIDRFARFDRYPTENNRKQACVPEGALAIENPVGTAPAFAMKSAGQMVFSLPGVPREMEHLLEHAVLPEIQRRFTLDSVLVVRILHTAGAGESQIDEKISDLESLSNPTVGLAAHSGQVDVRITAKAADRSAAEALITPLEQEIRSRLGRWIYGADEDTLASTAGQALAACGWRFAVLESGLGGALLQMLTGTLDGQFAGGLLLPSVSEASDTLQTRTGALRTDFGVDVGLGVMLVPGEKSEITIVLVTPAEEKSFRIPYGGPPGLAPLRAANLGLDTLRKIRPEQMKGNP